jgi:hypothetical protein
MSVYSVSVAVFFLEVCSREGEWHRPDTRKNNHETGFINQNGKHQGKYFRFSDTQKGFAIS